MVNNSKNGTFRYHSLTNYELNVIFFAYFLPANERVEHGKKTAIWCFRLRNPYFRTCFVTSATVHWLPSSHATTVGKNSPHHTTPELLQPKVHIFGQLYSKCQLSIHAHINENEKHSYVFHICEHLWQVLGLL